MSTKTTFKRVALVAVAALGFGVLTSVAPASADTGYTNAGTNVSTGITATVSSKALRAGKASAISVTFTGPAVTLYANETGTVTTGGFTRGTDYLNPNMQVLSAPSTSAVGTITPASYISSTQADLKSTSTTVFSAANLIAYAATINPVDKATTTTATLAWTPDLAGSYSFLFWNDANRDGAVSAGEQSMVYTVVVGDSIKSVTATTLINNGNIANTSNGAVVKVSLKDANGNATVPSSEAVVVTLGGGALARTSFVANASASGAGTNTAYLSYADFDASGNAYLGVTDPTAETAAATVSVIGSIATPTITNTTVSFKAATSYFTSSAVTALATTTTGSGAKYYTKGSASSNITLTAASTSLTTAATAALGIIEVDGKAFGNANIKADTIVTLTVADATTANQTYVWSQAPGTTSANKSYGLTFAAAAAAAAPSALTSGLATTPLITTNLVAGSAAAVVASPASQYLATGGTASFTVTAKDAYGTALSARVMTASVSGRNSAVAIASAITSSGRATFTYTDASTSTTSLTDTVSFTVTDDLGITRTGTATVNWATGFTVSAVTVSSSDTTAGVANGYSTPADISTSYAGAQAGAVAITASVTSSAGAVAGIPVTFSVAGTGAAIKSTAVTAYTNSLGVATSSIYGWVTGTYTVTATAGGVSGTGVQAFSQQSAAEVRTVSAVADNNAVVVTLKDRFGNPVQSATAVVYATVTSGSGYFANSTRSTSATGTDKKGQVTFIVTGQDSTVTVSTVNPNGSGAAVDETLDVAGYQGGTAVTGTVLTATTVGTTTTAEKGVGASYASAGVSSATASTSGAAAAQDTAQAAADAAAEATDAANAATDAANAAAEAADAATAAAQDAADAVAALSAQVADLISGLKAQLTALTNLVIKIQKKVKA